MVLNKNDSLEMSLVNYIYYDKRMNPLYAKFIIYLNEMGIHKLQKSNDYSIQMLAIEEYFKNNPDVFNKILKYAVDNGFLDDICVRYEYTNMYRRKRGEPNQFHMLKYKILDNRLYIYDMMLSAENQKQLEVTSINGYPAKEIIEKFYSLGYTTSQIEILIQHKEILSSFGFMSNKYEIVIDDKSIDLDSTNIDIDFNIFYKEHIKSELLDKNNFSLEQPIKSEASMYGFDSNMKLLQLLHGLSKSPKDLQMLENIYKNNMQSISSTIGNDTNIDWMFISSFFLMNQEEKNDLPDYLYLDLARKLKLASNGGPWLVFLNENNEEESYGYNVDNNSFGSNSYIYKNGKYDAKKVFHAIRDALAHSSYEVIDQDYIRVYFEDEKNHEITTNFKIKKDAVLEFIEKISEYRSFGNLFPICTLEHPNVDNKNISSQSELLDYLKEIVVSNIEIKSYSDLDKLKQMQKYAGLIARASNPDPEIYEDDYKLFNALEYDYSVKIEHLRQELENPMARETGVIRRCSENSLKIFADYEYQEIKLTNEQINRIIKQIENIKDTFYNHSAYNQHLIITELIKNELNPNRNISSIIGDIINTSNKSSGNIMDTLNESPTKYIDYDKVVKATIVAYLSNILLYNFNGNNIDCSGLDFTGMLKNLQPLINVKENDIKGKKAERGNKRKTVVKNEKRIEILERIIANKSDNAEDYLHEKAQREEENIRLTEEINKLDVIIHTLEMEIVNIKENSVVDNFFVLEHLRNSLAHGNILFSDIIDLTNIGDIEITFIDYDPKKKENDIPIESFRGTIKFSELLSSLNNEKYIASMFSKKDNPTLS